MDPIAALQAFLSADAEDAYELRMAINDWLAIGGFRPRVMVGHDAGSLTYAGPSTADVRFDCDPDDTVIVSWRELSVA